MVVYQADSTVSSDNGIKIAGVLLTATEILASQLEA